MGSIIRDAKITVVCQEYISELYEHCPEVSDIIASPSESDSELYEHCPEVSDIIASPSESDSDFKSEVRHREVIDKIRTKNPDILLNSVYSRHHLSDMKGLEFIPVRYAFRSRDGYTNLIPTEGQWKLELDRHCDFLKGLRITVDSLTPKMWLSDEDKKFASETFQRFNVDPKKVIVLFVGSRIMLRSYNRCGEALKGVCKEFGYKVIGVGITKEYEMNQKSLDVIGGGIKLSGKLTIRQTAAIIEQCRLTIGPDTSFSHIACAVQTPNVVIMGGGYRNRFFPYSDFTSVVSIPMDCWGCQYQCGDGKISCVKNISPDMVEKSIRKALKEHKT